MLRKLVLTGGIVAIAAGLLVISFYMINESEFFDEDMNNSTQEYTANYTSISTHELYDLLYNQSREVILVDVPSTGISRYNESHLENALSIHDKNHFPKGIKSLYNQTNDIVIYDDFDDLGDYFGVRYCKQLVNHTYGKIYYLDGGLTKWIEDGYPYWSDN